jgi:hypothetical protein
MAADDLLGAGREGRWEKDEDGKSAESASFAVTLLQHARHVFKWAPELAYDHGRILF